MRKNILIFGHNDAPQFIDIVNQYTRLFDKTHYEVTVAYLCGEPNEPTKTRTIAENILFLNIPKKQIRYLKIRAIQTLLHLCREKQFQIVICHRYKPTYIMLWVAQFYKLAALICVMHELGTMKSRGRQWLIKALTRKNTLFAGVSNAVRCDMQHHLPASPVVTLYNMMDVELTEPQLLSRQAARKMLHLSEDTFIFGTLGRLVPNKDQATLIQAFYLLKQHCPPAKLVIAGKGPLEQTLKQQAQALGIAQDIIFTGFIDKAFSYLNAFDCFVLSSTQEAFGRVLLEAMIAKLPVIATSVNGIPEVVGNAGLLIKARDATSFSKAMQHIYQLSSAERQTIGEKAYAHVLNHFSIPVFHSQFWHLPLLQKLK